MAKENGLIEDEVRAAKRGPFVIHIEEYTRGSAVYGRCVW